MKYQIGDQAWRATFSTIEAWVTCPECCGSGRLRIIMGDETIVSIECEGCEHGYHGSNGKVRVYDRTPGTERITIDAVSLRDDAFEYNGWIKEAALFAAQEDAFVAAVKLAEAASVEEREKIMRKEKDTRSWSWNATYHRRELKRAKEQVEYHTAKLAVADLRTKQAKRINAGECEG